MAECRECLYFDICKMYADDVRGDYEDSCLFEDCSNFKNKADVVESKAIEQIKWERDTAIEQLKSYGVGFCEKADVKKVKHGTWYHGTENGAVYAKCSACGRKMNVTCYGYAYCALCGARMDGERKEK